MGNMTDQDAPLPNDQMQTTRGAKYEARLVAAGFVRLTVRCHVDDLERIKTFAAHLMSQRERPEPLKVGRRRSRDNS